MPPINTENKIEQIVETRSFPDVAPQTFLNNKELLYTVLSYLPSPPTDAARTCKIFNECTDVQHNLKLFFQKWPYDPQTNTCKQKQSFLKILEASQRIAKYVDENSELITNKISSFGFFDVMRHRIAFEWNLWKTFIASPANKSHFQDLLDTQDFEKKFVLPLILRLIEPKNIVRLEDIYPSEVKSPGVSDEDSGSEPDPSTDISTIDKLTLVQCIGLLKIFTLAKIHHVTFAHEVETRIVNEWHNVTPDLLDQVIIGFQKYNYNLKNFKPYISSILDSNSLSYEFCFDKEKRQSLNKSLTSLLVLCYFLGLTKHYEPLLTQISLNKETLDIRNIASCLQISIGTYKSRAGINPANEEFFSDILTQAELILNAEQMNWIHAYQQNENNKLEPDENYVENIVFFFSTVRSQLNQWVLFKNHLSIFTNLHQLEQLPEHLYFKILCTIFSYEIDMQTQFNPELIINYMANNLPSIHENDLLFFLSIKILSAENGVTLEDALIFHIDSGNSNYHNKTLLEIMRHFACKDGSYENQKAISVIWNHFLQQIDQVDTTTLNQMYSLIHLFPPDWGLLDDERLTQSTIPI